MTVSRKRLVLILAAAALLGGCSKGGSWEPPPSPGAGSPPPAAPASEPPPAPAPAGPSYRLEVAGPEQGKPGEAIRARIKVTPGEGYKVNLEYPTKLELQGPAGGAPGKVVLTAKQATRLTEAELLMEPSFTVQAPGEHPFSGELRFSVCTDKLCEFKKLAVKWTTRVAP